MADTEITKVKILVASPGDVNKEREIVEEVVKAWNIRNSDKQKLVLEAVFWESHAAPESGERTQGILNRQIVDKCDFAIGIFWTRCGTDTGIAPGGAVEEVERMMSMKKQVMLYFSDVPISPTRINRQQSENLENFKASIQQHALVEVYNTYPKFRKKLAHQLDMQVFNWYCQDSRRSIVHEAGDLPTVDAAEAFLCYQDTLKEELGYIRMLGLPGVENVPVNLNDDTFVPLRLSESRESGKPFRDKSIHEGNEHILYPDEIMKRAFRKRRMLLVIGDPGAGKTTLLKYYALCALAGDHYTRLGFAVPVNVYYLPLRELARHEKGHYDSLPANLALWSERHHQSVRKELFEQWLRSGKALVLLDGLDEISNTTERKEVCHWIDNAWSGFSKACFVVTSRATGYRKDEGIELKADCERADVLDFTPEQQEKFLRNWFTAAFLREPCDNELDEAEWVRRQGAKADERTQKIVAHLQEEKNKGLRQLAAIPMILQIMAILWKERDYMPKSRVMLYNAVLDYLLEIRDERRGITPLLSAARARQVLAPVSLWMQEKLKNDEVPGAVMHKKMQAELDWQDKPPSASDFCDYLVKRAGLLVDSAGHDYLFRHKSFREYLAGVQLVTKVRSTRNLGTLVSGFGDDWWEEPIRFFFAEGDEELFNLFMKKLFDSPKSEELTTKQQLLLQTLIEEAPLKKVDALCKKLLDPSTTASRQRVILDCVKAIGKPAALDALKQFRAEALAKNSDVASRAEEIILALGGQASEQNAEQSAVAKKETTPLVIVEDHPRSFRNPNEHKAEYILIPGGSYIYSVTEEIVKVPDLYVAKYPVTNKLYRSFIDSLKAKGSKQEFFRAELQAIAESRRWHNEFGTYFKEEKNDLSAFFRSKYDEDRKFSGDDQPVVGVTSYAAQAYCLWLSMHEDNKTLYRLPTDVEWEWAAGGRQGTTGKKVREYPWPEKKGEPTSKLANYGENVRATTPVGSYPEGATPEGLYDMAGNVLEWCVSYDKNTPARSVRGGSWYYKSDYLRCSFRCFIHPEGSRSDDVGFRVVLPSHSLSF
ncbi:MAG: NACHT domain-containing protein [Chlorobium sp.]|nr:MAG: NACHT domain-containing protein [Chlorobium sp.]